MTSLAYGADALVIAPDLDLAPDIAEIHDWSGFYAGLNAGWGWGEGYDDVGVLDPPGPGVVDMIDGAIGGAQLGYNAQMDGFVFGLEADMQLSGMSQTIADPAGDVIFSINYFGTVRGRAGIAINSFMPYLTAGLAYGQGTIDLLALGGPVESGFHTGWTAGAGIEYAVDENFSVRAEYLYADLGQQNYPTPPAVGGEGLRFHAVRAGINFGF